MRPDRFVQLFSEKYLENIGNIFKTLYKDEELADVTLYCKEGSIKAHKLILAASSPYFHKIFRENQNDQPIIILHGISLKQLKNLIDLIYRGNVDIMPDDVDSLYDLAKEFEINGALDFDKGINGFDLGCTSQTENLHNRDTRYRGHKRVAVDYTEIDEIENTNRFDRRCVERRNSVENKNPVPKATVAPDLSIVKQEPQSSTNQEDDDEDVIEVKDEPEMCVDGQSPKLNAWARKQRKFKCELCPSSFKRSSHLSRHQLVHTGERPFACEQCDKAFSRHDKLKHHIRKAHEAHFDDTIDLSSNEMNPGELSSSDISSSNLSYIPPAYTNSPLFLSNKLGPILEDYTNNSFTNRGVQQTISHISSVLEDSLLNPPAKKGRGRPRKYPPAPLPIKCSLGPPITNTVQEVLGKGKREKHKTSPVWKPLMKRNRAETGSQLLKKRGPGRPRVKSAPVSLQITVPQGLQTTRPQGRSIISEGAGFFLKQDWDIDKYYTNPAYYGDPSNIEYKPAISTCPPQTELEKLLFKTASQPPQQLLKRPRGRPRIHKQEIGPKIKRPPGRPRIHNIVQPLIKRKPGRPRIHPVPQPLVKRGRGRPRLNPVVPDPKPADNYDITNLPFGDLEYLTSPLRNPSHNASIDDPVMIEPYVEINTDQHLKDDIPTATGLIRIENNIAKIGDCTITEEPMIEPLVEIQTGEVKNEVSQSSSSHNYTINDFETKIAKIGECTISVAN